MMTGIDLYTLLASYFAVQSLCGILFRLTKIKKERRQKDVARKQKAAENRRHLANIRYPLRSTTECYTYSDLQ